MEPIDSNMGAEKLQCGLLGFRGYRLRISLAQPPDEKPFASVLLMLLLLRVRGLFLPAVRRSNIPFSLGRRFFALTAT